MGIMRKSRGFLLHDLERILILAKRLAIQSGDWLAR